MTQLLLSGCLGVLEQVRQHQGARTARPSVAPLVARRRTRNTTAHLWRSTCAANNANQNGAGLENGEKDEIKGRVQTETELPSSTEEELPKEEAPKEEEGEEAPQVC